VSGSRRAWAPTCPGPDAPGSRRARFATCLGDDTPGSRRAWSATGPGPDVSGTSTSLRPKRVSSRDRIGTQGRRCSPARRHNRVMRRALQEKPGGQPPGQGPRSRPSRAPGPPCMRSAHASTTTPAAIRERNKHTIMQNATRRCAHSFRGAIGSGPAGIRHAVPRAAMRFEAFYAPVRRWTVGPVKGNPPSTRPSCHRTGPTQAEDSEFGVMSSAAADGP
jgi:hypothetical protein